MPITGPSPIFTKDLLKEKIMQIIISFLPILTFITIYVGSGIYFSYQGTPNAFYQISPLVAIIPGIVVGWILNKSKTNEERMNSFIEGISHKDIITMCLIFMLAGAFSSVTKSIGSVESTVNLSLSLIPHSMILLGLFIISAFISTSIGTSMGTIATIAPIAAGLADQGAIPMHIGMATVIGGAMFGDNLSIISDTTIAAVLSQGADFKLKLKLNGKLALFACSITTLVLLLIHSNSTEIAVHEYSLILILPYIILLGFAIFGYNVLISLLISTATAGLIGYISKGYNWINFSKDITHGFASMHEIMLLSLLVGGLAGLVGKGSQDLAKVLTSIVDRRKSKIVAQLMIAKVVSIFDILLANNTVAIIFSGNIAKHIAQKYDLPKHLSAVWLDIFSCVFQGIIPYGAQIMLASSIGKISPLSVVPHVYYCYILGIISILYILLKKR